MPRLWRTVIPLALGMRDVSVRCGRWSPKNYNGSHGSGRRVTMADALRVSLNTTAVALSLKIGRKKIINYVNQLGIRGPRASCSMALGDTGITPLSHAGGFASFANGGFRAAPYALIEVYNGEGELVYNRKRDEPKPPRVFTKSTVAQMNQMLKGVVDNGTGKRAQLEFTHAAGKTGTSSSYRDAWFMGYTGKLVTGVWVGRDDFRPVYRPGGKGMTGGSVPATIWQAFMSVAHKSFEMPTLLGLRDHPRQVEERQRLAELRRRNPALAQQTGAEGVTAPLIGAQTKKALLKLVEELRNARRPGKKAAIVRPDQTTR